MATYHCKLTAHTKTKGHTAMAGCAYRAGLDIDEHKFRYKEEVEELYCVRNGQRIHYSEDQRIQLFRDYEKVNKRKDAGLGVEAEFSLPRELTVEQNKILVAELLDEFSKRFKDQLLDVGFHNKDSGDEPHLHLWRSDRILEDDYLKWGNKYRTNDAQRLDDIYWTRKIVSTVINKHYEMHGFEHRISHLSLEDQGIDRPAQEHDNRRSRKKGYVSPHNRACAAMKKADEDIAELEKEKKILNQETQDFLDEIKRHEEEINKKILQLKQEIDEISVQEEKPKIDFSSSGKTIEFNFEPVKKAGNPTPEPFSPPAVDPMIAIENQSNPTQEQEKILDELHPQDEEEPTPYGDLLQQEWAKVTAKLEQERQQRQRPEEDQPPPDCTPTTQKFTISYDFEY